MLCKAGTEDGEVTCWSRPFQAVVRVAWSRKCPVTGGGKANATDSSWWRPRLIVDVDDRQPCEHSERAILPVDSIRTTSWLLYGVMFCSDSRNAFFCCSRYEVADILCYLMYGLTLCWRAHNIFLHSLQRLCSVLLLLELLFIRDGSFCCSSLSSHDIGKLVDFTCTSWSE